MKIDKVRLTNYRCHRDIAVSFSPHFNVLVGANGSGKTSLLKGIAELFNGFVGGVSSKSIAPTLTADSVRVERIDIQGRLRFEEQYPVSVLAEGSIGDKRLSWGVTREAPTGNFTYLGGQPGDVWKTASDKGVNTALAKKLPILAFYQANRQWNLNRASELEAATSKDGRMNAYNNFFNASSDAASLQTWVISKCLERFQVSSETNRLFDEVTDDELALVNGALANAIGEIQGIKFDMREKSLLVEWKQSAGSSRSATVFGNLSDGQKAVVGLIVDIARRICLLNPQLGQSAIKETPGIVLIDELDMHLHPKWQRALTLGLQSAFPSVQFIVASHSPQILGEMKPEQIIVLTGGTTSNPQVSYGLDSSAVLEEIMDVPARPLEVANELSALFEALERNELNVARQHLAKLRAGAPGIVELNRAEALLKRKEVLGR
ncbi:hypothetical protein DR64_1359 [Paraburkholderia xenovorans LB400]|jgi:predicted ATP-binding protein involved in virulence|uniref:AAA family ATPase n=1 Tax=Paraburkholderia xenovorans TaxID=36873 RepID=UPI00031617C6|nr:AAA family ATPase [Paraburkholderia xenovorans]AIP33628.1 hypothetical protein DR64_1359 [Paraburkholderia xenovorans LB400]